jgi:hypothetical protein
MKITAIGIKRTITLGKAVCSADKKHKVKVGWWKDGVPYDYPPPMRPCPMTNCPECWAPLEILTVVLPVTSKQMAITDRMEIENGS